MGEGEGGGGGLDLTPAVSGTTRMDFEIDSDLSCLTD